MGKPRALWMCARAGLHRHGGGRSIESLGVTSVMESLPYVLVSAWAAALSAPALWLYARTEAGRDSIRTLFAVAAVLCAVTLLTSWMMIQSFFSRLTVESALIWGIPIVVSLIGTVAIARLSFAADQKRSNRDA